MFLHLYQVSALRLFFFTATNSFIIFVNLILNILHYMYFKNYAIHNVYIVIRFFKVK